MARTVGAVVLAWLLAAALTSGEPLSGPFSAEELARRFVAHRPRMGDFRLSQRLFEAVNLGCSYGYAFEPGERGYVRQDEYTCTSDCGPVEAGAEVSFIRVFATARAAVAAGPPGLDSLPPTAARALAMRHGDVVALTTRASVVARATATVLELAPAVHLEGQARCMVSGAFDLQVIRGSRRFVHLRVLQRSEVLAGVGTGVVAGFSLFGRDLGAAIRLSHEACAALRVMAHYCVDLGSEAARAAFDRALSGSVRLLGPDVPVHDLTGLDELADEDEDELAVRRINAAVVRSTGRRQTVVFHVPRFEAGFEREWCRNALTVRSDGMQDERHYRAALYRKRSSLSGPGGGFFERSSGMLLHASADGTARSVGPHWFCWNRQSPLWHSTVPSSTLAEFANVLGPLARRLDLEGLFRPDRRQRWQCLQVVLSSRAMEALFDERRTTDDVIARALTAMVRAMDVQFMLPFNPLPCNRSETDVQASSPEFDEALAVMAHTWGRWYAGYFRNVFMPRLRAARRSSDMTVKMAFLADLYDAGLGANDFGGPLLSRFLLEVLDVLGLADTEAYAAVTMTYHVPADTTEDPTVRSTHGTVEDRAVLDTLWRLTSTHLFEY